MKYQTATLFLAGLAAAAPVAQSPGPFSTDAARAGGILSGLADGLKGSQIPGADSIASILQGLGGGLNGQPSRNANIDLNSIIQNVEKRQNQPARPPPTTADMERASSIISGLADGLKGSTIPGAASIASILQGLGGGIGNGAKATPTVRSVEEREKRQNQPAHQPPTSADMERASGILKGLSDGLKGAFPGSDGIASILQGLGGGIGNGAKTAPTVRSVEELEKRQGTAMPPPGTPEARKSAGQIIDGLAKGIKGSTMPGSDALAGILTGVGSSLTAAGSV